MISQGNDQVVAARRKYTSSPLRSPFWRLRELLRFAPYGIAAYCAIAFYFRVPSNEWSAPLRACHESRLSKSFGPGGEMLSKASIMLAPSDRLFVFQEDLTGFVGHRISSMMWPTRVIPLGRIPGLSNELRNAIIGGAWPKQAWILGIGSETCKILTEVSAPTLRIENWGLWNFGR